MEISLFFLFVFTAGLAGHAIVKQTSVRCQIKSNQISLFLTQLQLQQNELKLNTQNAQLKAGKKI